MKKRLLTSESLKTLDVRKVKAVQFAEVGSQGRSEYVSLVSQGDAEVCVDSGEFGFPFGGERMEGDVEIEELEAVVPFLAAFRGTSPETTRRGLGLVQGGQWIHLDAGGGNHLFVRVDIAEAVARQFDEKKLKFIHPSDVYRFGLSTVLEVLEAQA